MIRSIPYLSMSEFLNDFFQSAGIDRRKNYLTYLNHAKWIWKKIFQTTIFSVQHKFVKIDRTTTPYSIPIPKNSVRIINVSVTDDCNNMRSLSYAENMNILSSVNCDACSVCGEKDVVTECVNNISLVQKEVLIDGDVYIEKIWKRLCPNGDLKEVREIPVKKYNSIDPEDGYEIVFETIEKHVCQFEKKSCGCIANTPSNIELLNSSCGVLYSGCQTKLCDRTFAKQNAKFGEMRIKDGRIYVRGNLPEYAIVSFQTNGECADSEIMIPEYAVEAIQFGMIWRATSMSPRFINNRLAVREARRTFDASVEELDQFLNPIYIKEFMDVQMILPKWGSKADQRDMLDDGKDLGSMAASQGLSVTEVNQLIENKIVNIKEGDTIIQGGGELWEGEW